MFNGPKIQVGPREWLMLAAALLMGSAIYTILIYPSLQLIGDGGEALRQKQRAEGELAAATETHEHLQHRLDAGRERLEELGGAPPSARENDRKIDRLTSLAQKSLITIDRYQPIEIVEQSDHSAFFVEFAGRGDFLMLLQYFRHIERDIDFVDVTHFSITHIENHQPPMCLVTWSCRINGMLAEDALEPTSPQDNSKHRLREVTWHEP